MPVGSGAYPRGVTAGPSTPGAAPVTRSWRPTAALDLRRTLAPLGRGPFDPVHRVGPDGALWRTTRTPDGPASLRLTVAGGEVRAQAWGPGADRVLAAVPELCGAHHACTLTGHPLLEHIEATHPGVRQTRTRAVYETAVLAVLEQKVTGKQARTSWQRLAARCGAAPPGPAPDGMRVLPPPRALSLLPSWEWHALGVDPQRAAAVATVCRVMDSLERLLDAEPGVSRRALASLPGLGVWTAAEIAQRAFGDCDAVSFGDYHVAAAVGWALLGRPVDDPGMERVLAPWAPHRGRVVRMLELGGPAKPRFGPRTTIQDMRRL